MFILTRVLSSLQVIDFELPIQVKVTVVESDPGVKGDTAQGNINMTKIPLHSISQMSKIPLSN